jgi:hypothetical protein
MLRCSLRDEKPGSFRLWTHSSSIPTDQRPDSMPMARQQADPKIGRQKDRAPAGFAATRDRNSPRRPLAQDNLHFDID